MKNGYVYAGIVVMLIIGILAYAYNPRVNTFTPITGAAVKTNDENLATTVQPSINNDEAVKSDRVCSGFGFVRKQVMPDGSVQEYCYDPCDGNADCVANWDSNSQDDTVVVAPSEPSSITQIVSQPATTSTTVSGGGSPQRKR